MLKHKLGALPLSQTLKILIAIGLISSPSFVSCAKPAQEHPKAPVTQKTAPADSAQDETSSAEDSANKEQPQATDDGATPSAVAGSSQAPSASGETPRGNPGNEHASGEPGSESGSESPAEERGGNGHGVIGGIARSGGAAQGNASNGDGEDQTNENAEDEAGVIGGESAGSTVSPADANTAGSGIRVITVTPGNDITSAFGHAAIEIDGQVYEWGGFNVNHIMASAGRGGLERALMMLLNGEIPSNKIQTSVERFEARYLRNANVARTIRYDELHLSESQKAKLLELIKESFDSRNRRYQYNHFTRNCATEVLDLIIAAVESDGADLDSELDRQVDTSYQEVTMASMDAAAASDLQRQKVGVIPSNMRRFAPLLVAYGIRAELSGGSEFLAMLNDINDRLQQRQPGSDIANEFHEFLTVAFPATPKTRREMMFTPKRLREGLAGLVNPVIGRTLLNPARTQSKSSTDGSTQPVGTGTLGGLGLDAHPILPGVALPDLQAAR